MAVLCIKQSGLQQRKGVDFVLEGLQQLQSILKLVLDILTLPAILHDRHHCIYFLTWQKGNTTEQYNNLDGHVHCTKHNQQDLGSYVLEACQE